MIKLASLTLRTTRTPTFQLPISNSITMQVLSDIMLPIGCSKTRILSTALSSVSSKNRPWKLCRKFGLLTSQLMKPLSRRNLEVKVNVPREVLSRLSQPFIVNLSTDLWPTWNLLSLTLSVALFPTKLKSQDIWNGILFFINCVVMVYWRVSVFAEKVFRLASSMKSLLNVTSFFLLRQRKTPISPIGKHNPKKFALVLIFLMRNTSLVIPSFSSKPELSETWKMSVMRKSLQSWLLFSLTCDTSLLLSPITKWSSDVTLLTSFKPTLEPSSTSRIGNGWKSCTKLNLSFLRPRKARKCRILRRTMRPSKLLLKRKRSAELNLKNKLVLLNKRRTRWCKKWNLRMPF